MAVDKAKERGDYKQRDSKRFLFVGSSGDGCGAKSAREYPQHVAPAKK